MQVDEHEALLSFLYQCPIGIIEINQRGKINMINPLASQLLMPLVNKHNIGLENLIAIIQPYVPEFTSKITHSAGNTGKLIENQIINIEQTQDEIPQYYSLTVIKIHENRFMVVLQNISELVKQENRAREAIRNESLQRGKLQMVTGILHDIGNACVGLSTKSAQLAAKNNWSEIQQLQRLQSLINDNSSELDQALGDGKGHAMSQFIDSLCSALHEKKEEYKEFSIGIAKSVRHIQDIISIQKQYARDGFGYKRQAINIYEVVENALSIQRELLQKHNIKTHTEKIKLPVLVLGDPTKLIQVLLNVLKNSIEAILSHKNQQQENIINIEIATDNEEAIIKIQDNGIGFDNFVAKQLFIENFTSKESGSGIGLSSCQQIISTHNGSISIQSPGENQGATVTIKLPLHGANHVN